MKGSQFLVTNWDQFVMGAKYNSPIRPKSSNYGTKFIQQPFINALVLNLKDT